MRILHVNKYLYRRGGAESYMFDVAGLQRARGHEVELWGMHHPENVAGLPLEPTFTGYVELDPPPGGLAGLASAGTMVWSRSNGRLLAEAISRFRPDVVHCHNVYHQLSPSVLRAAKRSGTTLVMTLHDYKLACPSYQLLDHGAPCQACVGGSTLPAIRRRCKGGSLAGSTLLAVESGLHRALGAYDPVDLFISPSRFLAEVVERQGVGRDRLRVVPHFVEAEGVPRADGSGTSLVLAARIAHEKGVDVLVEAARLAPEVTVHVAGDGPERAALQANSPSNVTWHGRLPKTEVQRLVAASAGVVVPSTWHENQPMTILEAYAAGVPAVVTAMGGMPELVRDGVDGLVVPPHDAPALAAALRRLASDPTAAVAMGRAGRERLLEVHDPGRHLDALEDAYAAAGAR